MSAFCSPTPQELLTALLQGEEAAALQALEQWLDGDPCPMQVLGLIVELTCAACKTGTDPGVAASVGQEAARLLLGGEGGEPLWEAIRQWVALVRAEPPLSERIRQAVFYLHAHYASPDLKREEVARQAQLCLSRFSQVFHKEVGVTYEKYLTDLRIEKARWLLAGTSLTVEEIAEKVGYRGARSFFRAFRREVGVTPGQYRRELTEGSGSP